MDDQTFIKHDEVLVHFVCKSLTDRPKNIGLLSEGLLKNMVALREDSFSEMASRELTRRSKN